MVTFDDLGVPPTIADGELRMLESADSSWFDLSQCDLSPALSLCVQFLFNMLVCSLIVWIFYYSKSRRKDFAVTFMFFSAAVFLLLYFMGSVSIDITVGLGLFMIFGIMRYRTEMVPIREMTYLFIAIAMAVINGINVINDRLILANALLLGLLFVVERIITRRREASRLICYERIDLIRPDRRSELVADLEARLGVKIDRVEIGNVDFLRDVAFLRVYYTPDGDEVVSTDSVMKINEKNAFNKQ